MTLAPIVLFVYNRPWHTMQTVEALQKNELANESELFIYSDAPKNKEAEEKVQKVREYIKSIDGFKKVIIIERKENLGLANSIIDGVAKIVKEYGKIIVLEDDLVTSPYFLKFMNQSLVLYEHEERVVSIHGYIYPIEGLPDTFFIRGADCWGWATWKDRWNIFEPDGKKLLNQLQNKQIEREADFNGSYGFVQMLKNQIDGKNNSWAIRWYISSFLANKLTLYPGVSYVKNIGLDNTGTHCSKDDRYLTNINEEFRLKKIDVAEDLEAKKKMIDFFRSQNKTFIEKVSAKIHRLFT